MSEQAESQLNHARSSRQRYRAFVKKYKEGQLDQEAEPDTKPDPTKETPPGPETESMFGFGRGKRREHMRAYLRWLKPHRYAIGGLFALALGAGGLELAEPLFMR